MSNGAALAHALESVEDIRRLEERVEQLERLFDCRDRDHQAMEKLRHYAETEMYIALEFYKGVWSLRVDGYDESLISIDGKRDPVEALLDRKDKQE